MKNEIESNQIDAQTYKQTNNFIYRAKQNKKKHTTGLILNEF